MAITLRIEPGKIISRREFVASYPRYSIALDGYVSGEPFFEPPPRGPLRNFNHHESVDRSSTCATCEQVRRAALLGLFEVFADEQGPRAEVWVNDCDQDICLATWILNNPARAGEPLVSTLAHIEDLLDTSGGWLLPPGHDDLLGEVRWIFQPYTLERPQLAALDAGAMGQVISAVHARIDRFLVGDSESLAAYAGYRCLGGDTHWKLVELSDQHARQQLAAAGINAAVELYGRHGDRYLYSVWRRSEYIVDFPVREILRELNRVEGYEADDLAGWGGSDNVGGSPRRGGSRLSPAQVEAVVARVVDKSRGN